MSGILMTLAGGGSTQIIASDQTIDAWSSSSALASYSITAGTVWATSNLTNETESALLPSSAYTLFEAKAETSSGTSPSGSALSTYFDLNAVNPQWFMYQSTAGITTGVFIVTIREKANVANNKSVTVTMTAEVSATPP